MVHTEPVMYVPKHFAASNDVVRELLSNQGAADLITTGDDGLAATVVPFIFDPDEGENGALHGHIARANSHWRLTVNGEALVIVRGPDTYVSPSWYPSKAENERVVPTWNYSVLHVRGRLEWHHEPAWIESLVQRLTDKHEQALGAQEPWRVDDAPKSFIDKQLRAVVGVSIEITSVEAKMKMSQNRSQSDAAGVVTGLASSGRTAVAEAVRSANLDESDKSET